MKTCNKCKIEKNIHDFVKDKNRKDGLYTQCKSCSKRYRENNKQKITLINAKYYQDNKKYIIEHNKQYYIDNKEYIDTRNKDYYYKNRENILEYRRNYYQENKQQENEKLLERIHYDINYKLAHYLRNRITKIIKRNQKSGSAIIDLGCSIEDFKQYIEQKFQSGMSWENYGEWHLDHIIPLSSFDLTERVQFLKACHYTNYQPLWAIDNLRKGDKLDWCK